MDNKNDFLPLRIVSFAKPDEKYDNRFAITNSVVLKNGKELFSTTNGKLAKHIVDSANSYRGDSRTQYVISQQAQSEVICYFEIEGLPIIRKDNNIIKKNRDGTYVIGTDKEFSDRSRFLQKEIGNITYQNRAIIPLDCTVNIEFIFYIKKRKKDMPSISSLVDAGLDEMIKLGILHSKTIRYVSGTNGSRVVYIQDGKKEKIQTIIRRVDNGH